MQFCFFDDEIASNFLPLTLTRPTDDLRIGILTIKEKWAKWLASEQISRICHVYLKDRFPSTGINKSKLCIWLNSRCIPTKNVVEAILDLNPEEALFYDKAIIAIKSDGKQSNQFLLQNEIPSFTKRITLSKSPKLITYFWDLLHLNGNQISEDLNLLEQPQTSLNKLHQSISITNPDQVFVSKLATIEPGTVLMAEDGPIYIGPNAKVEAGSVIKGPVAICEYAQVKMQARIYNATTIGPVCKAGGEVSNCIFHSYSNKSHDGFTGNSIFGQWCNLAAGTITSNLKTNYGPIKIPHWDSGELSEDSVQFFGTVFGDFSKTAIQTKINVGTICGVSSNIFVSGFTPKKIPSFTWLGDDGPKEYDFPKSIEAMRAMMARRDVELDNDYIQMMKAIFASRSPS